jgi:hypothetical protein
MHAVFSSNLFCSVLPFCPTKNVTIAGNALMIKIVMIGVPSATILRSMSILFALQIVRASGLGAASEMLYL